MIRTPFYLVVVDGIKLTDEYYRKIESITFKEPEEGEEFFTIDFVDNDMSIMDSTLFVEDRSVVSLAFGYTDDYAYLMDGLVSTIKPDFPVTGNAKLKVTIKSVANTMDRVDRFNKYVGLTYSEIVVAIGARYGLTVDAQNTKSIYDPSLFGLEGMIQVGISDWMFMKSIAKRIGFDCYIRSGVLYFKEKKDKLPTSALLLEYRIGNANLMKFTPTLSTTGNSNASTISNVNILDKSVVGSKSAPKLVATNGDVNQGQKYHTVAKGEYVIKIAKKYGVNWKDVIKVNPAIKAPKYVIYPNQKILIP